MHLVSLADSPLVLLQLDERFRLFCTSSLLLMDIPASSWEEARTAAEQVRTEWPDPPRINPERDDGHVFLTISLSLGCNLTCEYCYIHGARPDWPRDVSKSVSPPSIQGIFDEIRSILNSRPTRFEINFIGGEPLLLRNVIFDIVSFARALAITESVPLRIGLTTNGTLLDKSFLKWSVDQDVSLMVSLDSPAHIHDTYRSHGTPGANFDHIVKNLRGFESGILVATTITRQTPSFREALEPLLNLGFKEVFVNFVHTRDPGFALGYGDVQRFSEEWEKDHQWYTDECAKVGNIRRIHELLSQRCYKEQPCGAGRSGHAIGPSGGRYLCHNSVNRKGYEFDSRMKPRSPQLEARLSVSLDETECRDCWVKGLCGGDCWLLRWDYSPVERDVRCQLIRGLAQLALCVYPSPP